MTNYEELVKALRCKRDDCEGCDLAFFDKDEGWMCRYAAKDDDAADAIEKLLESVGMLGEQRSYWIDKAAEYYNQLPKRGEWIGVSPFVDSEQCSVCGYCIHSEELETPYCPWCGAKMEVQDGQA